MKGNSVPPGGGGAGNEAHNLHNACRLLIFLYPIAVSDATLKYSPTSNKRVGARAQSAELELERGEREKSLPTCCAYVVCVLWSHNSENDSASTVTREASSTGSVLGKPSGRCSPLLQEALTCIHDYRSVF